MTKDDIKASASRPSAEEMITFDREKLAQIGRIVIGNRSIQEFCEERDLSRSLVSKLLNQTLNGPLTIRSIYKFIGDGNEHQMNEMLEACGYPPVALELLDKMKDLKPSSKSEQYDPIDDTNWQPTAGLQLVLDKLFESGFGDHFRVDFRSDGLFAIETGPDNSKLVGIPAFCSSLQNSDNDYEHTLKQFGKAVSIWSPAESFYCILTNSKGLANELASIPNLGFGLAILLTTDRHNFSGHRVSAQMGDNEKKDVSILKYIVDL